MYSTRAIVLIVLSVRLAAFMYKLSLGNLEVGSECHAKYRRTYCVVARKNPLSSERVTESLYSQGVFHTSLRLEFPCARLAVMVVNQKFIAINYTYICLLHFFQLFFSPFHYFSTSCLILRLFVCLIPQLSI